MLRARRGLTPRCPFCHDDIERGNRDRARCVLCRTLHHAVCFAESGKCTTLGCDSRSVVSRMREARVPSASGFRAMGVACAVILHLLVIAALPLYVPGCHICPSGSGVYEPLALRPTRTRIDFGDPRAPRFAFDDISLVSSSALGRPLDEELLEVRVEAGRL